MINGKKNGHAVAAPLPRRTVKFTIGEEVVEVPSIGFLYLDGNEDLRTHLMGLSPDIPQTEYVKLGLRIIANLLNYPESGETAERLAARREATYQDLGNRLMIFGEPDELVTSIGELLVASGFRPPEPTETAPAENPGTGMSTDSVPSSPSEVSAEATPLS